MIRSLLMLLALLAASGSSAKETNEERGIDGEPAAEAQATPVDPPLRIFEAFAGRYQSVHSRGDAELAVSSAWHGTLTLRTPAWRRWRLFGLAETAAQSGATSAKAFATWNGATLMAGGSRALGSLREWRFDAFAAFGSVVALGDDRSRLDVSPSVFGVGLRIGYAEGERLSWRVLAGCGFRNVVTDLGDGAGSSTSRAATCEADNLFRLPLLGDRIAIHARTRKTFASAEWPGDWKLRYGIVAAWR